MSIGRRRRYRDEWRRNAGSETLVWAAVIVMCDPLALVALVNVVVFGALVWATGSMLDRAHLERRRAEQAAQSTHKLLQGIADNSPAVIYLKDIAGRYLLVNRRYEQLFHIRPEEMVGKTDYDVFPREVANAFHEVDARVTSSAAVVEAEEVAPHDDGPYTYISIKYPLIGPSGEVHGVCGISTDITERKRAEQALRENQERTSAIIKAALDGIIVIDHLGDVVEFNPAAERLFGYRKEHVIGKRLADLVISPNLRERHRQGLARYMSTGEAAVIWTEA